MFSPFDYVVVFAKLKYTLLCTFKSFGSSFGRHCNASDSQLCWRIFEFAVTYVARGTAVEEHSAKTREIRIVLSVITC